MLVNSFSGAIGMWVLLNLFQSSFLFLFLFYVHVVYHSLLDTNLNHLNHIQLLCPTRY